MVALKLSMIRSKLMLLSRSRNAVVALKPELFNISPGGS